MEKWKSTHHAPCDIYWTGAGILKILTELSSDTAQKFALVMVTHSPEASAICDRVLTLEDGLLK